MSPSTKTVIAYAATSATAPLSKTTITRREVGPHDVGFDIHFAGICHSDINTVRAEWGQPRYPVVPGHEIAGIVAEIGSAVTKFKVGDRVGVGCFVDSCRECKNCRAGVEQYCTGGGMVGTYNGVGKDGQPTQGGYSGSIVVDENYVMTIPAALPLDTAAPLLCAGITTYSPLRHWKVGPGARVGLIGLGGLGHMGVKLAAAMGAEVTVLSQSLKKMEDGLRLGAKAYHATSDRDTFKTLQLVRRDPQHRLSRPRPTPLPRPAGSRRRLRRTWRTGKPYGGAGLLAHRYAANLDRFEDRRDRRDPGDAGILCRTRDRLGSRGDRAGLHQRGLRTGGRQ